MSTLTLKKISQVPEQLFSRILLETSFWDLTDRQYENFDPAFKKHQSKGFKISKVSRSKNETIPSFLHDVVDWIKHIDNENLVPAQAMLNVILPNQQFPVHIDSLKLHQHAKRYHICLDNADIEYYFFDGEEIIKEYMIPGHLYLYNNLIPHSVRNPSTLPRTNLILDMLPKDVDMDQRLLSVVPDVINEWESIKRKFSSKYQLAGFTKDSII